MSPLGEDDGQIVAGEGGTSGELADSSFTYELAKYSAVISTLRGVRDIAAFFASEASSVSDSYI